MVKLAVFSAWAELQIASQEHIYLDDVVRPHLEELTPLWLVLLREYARLKFEPDVSSTSAPTALTGGLDMVYAALNRETLLQVSCAQSIHHQTLTSGSSINRPGSSLLMQSQVLSTKIVISFSML